MKNGSFFTPQEKLSTSSAMKNFEGLQLFWETDPAVARRILPPPLEFPDPEHPIVYAPMSPTFANPGSRHGTWKPAWRCLAVFARSSAPTS